MKAKQTDRAFELAETWINGNRSYVIEALRGELPIVAIAIAFQIAAIEESESPSFQNASFHNAIDRLAESEIPNTISVKKGIKNMLRDLERYRSSEGYRGKGSV